MKHTPGPWEAELKLNMGRLMVHGHDNNAVCKMADARSNNQNIANARLIAEAGTVAHETGLTPRQLAEQRKELLEACKAILEARSDREINIEDKEYYALQLVANAIATTEAPHA